MNVRELLQIEIWSKETSRKILRRTWRILRPVAVVFGVLVLLLAVVFAVEWYWLTSGERQAGRTALAKIEELEKLEWNASDGFDAIDSQVKPSVTVAKLKAWTLRDRNASAMLELYLWELETEHENRIRESRLRLIAIERHQNWPSNPELEKEHRDSQAQIFSSMRSYLHKQLD
jgi:hypothetical protein